MNKSAIYEQIAMKMLQQKLSVFRTKPKAIQFVKEIITMYEEEKMKRNILDNEL